MKTYLELSYPEAEYGINEYPQKLCNYISEQHFLHPTIRRTKGGKLLDIGSGRGNHLVAFRRCGYDVYGLDKRQECLDALESFSFTIKECDIENEAFPYENNFFDCLFSKSVLEHVWNTDNFLSETLRVLRTGGKAVLIIPAWESQYKLFYDDPTHVRPFTKKGLQKAMTIAGFHNVRVSLFLQLPFVWKHPCLGFIPKLISLLPDSLKWKDYEQSEHRRLIRFSKEKMLLAVGEKP